MGAALPLAIFLFFPSQSAREGNNTRGSHKGIWSVLCGLLPFFMGICEMPLKKMKFCIACCNIFFFSQFAREMVNKTLLVIGRGSDQYSVYFSLFWSKFAKCQWMKWNWVLPIAIFIFFRSHSAREKANKPPLMIRSRSAQYSVHLSIFINVREMPWEENKFTWGENQKEQTFLIHDKRFRNKLWWFCYWFGIVVPTQKVITISALERLKISPWIVKRGVDSKEAMDTAKKKFKKKNESEHPWPQPCDL